MTAATPQLISATLDALNKVLLGKENQIKLALAGLLAGGHLLLEDLPGMGKTTLAHALARVCGLEYQRMQFTSDLLPTDIIGMTIFDMESKKFHFKRGPLFTSILLADEINRATPKTQSALLQAMEEQQVSVEGKQVDLSEPFFVIATQNPLEQSGTFALPESQLDRFSMRISLGYPSAEFEQQLLLTQGNKRNGKKPTAIFNPADVSELTQQVNQVHVSQAIVEYLQTLLASTRTSSKFMAGLSPRAGLQWLQAAKALALVEKRNAVLPEDIKMLAPYTAAHRLHCNDGDDSVSELTEIIKQTEVL